MPSIEPFFASIPIVSSKQISIGNAVLFGPVAFGWGRNNYGQVGDNTATNRSSPVVLAGSIPFSQIANGYGHAAAINSLDDTAWCWGRAATGQIGDNQTAANRSSPVSVIGGHFFLKIGAGIRATAGIKIDKSAWCWGYNGTGILGDGTATNRSSPVSVVGAHSFEAIAISDHTIGLKIDGSLWAWGNNGSGALGDNSTTYRSSPVSVLGAHSAIQITAGTSCSGLLKSDGSAWTFGSAGSIGDNAGVSRSSPVSVAGAHSFTKLRVGASAIAMKSDGSAWMWGGNFFGEIGDGFSGSTFARSSPVSVLGNHSFIDVAATASAQGSTSASPALGLKSDGSIWAWGQNIYGGLATGDSLFRMSPVKIINDFMFSSLGVREGGENMHVVAMGFGSLKLLLTAGANGTRVEAVLIQALQTTTAGMIRLWTGTSISNLTMLKEIPVTAVTQSSTAVAFAQTIGLGAVVPAGQSLYVGTSNFEKFSIIVEAAAL